MSNGYSEKGTGWIGFAAIMLGFAGTLDVLDGIVALSKSSFYVAGAHYVFSDLRTWAWISIILGALSILAAFGIVSGAQWARWYGIFIAAVSAIGATGLDPALPVVVDRDRHDRHPDHLRAVRVRREDRPRERLALRLVGAPAPGRPHETAQAANCASSVEPLSARVEAIPPEITWATWSK